MYWQGRSLLFQLYKMTTKVGFKRKYWRKITNINSIACCVTEMMQPCHSIVIIIIKCQLPGLFWKCRTEKLSKLHSSQQRERRRAVVLLYSIVNILLNILLSFIFHIFRTLQPYRNGKNNFSAIKCCTYKIWPKYTHERRMRDQCN